jgi:hypothetical protein
LTKSYVARGYWHRLFGTMFDVSGLDTKGDVDWRRLANERNVSLEVARGLWSQCKRAADIDIKFAERLYVDALTEAASKNATHEPGRQTLVDAKGVKDPASLGPGKSTLVLAENYDRGPAGTAAKSKAGPRKASAKPQPGSVSAEKLYQDLAKAAESAKAVIELLKQSDDATIVEALRELKEIEGPEFIKQLMSVADGAIANILMKFSPELQGVKQAHDNKPKHGAAIKADVAKEQATATVGKDATGTAAPNHSSSSALMSSTASNSTATSAASTHSPAPAAKPGAAAASSPTEAAALEPYFPSNVAAQQAVENRNESMQIPTDPMQQKQWLETQVAKYGLGTTTLMVVGQHQKLLGDPLRVMRAQADVLGDRLTIAARRAAEDLLNASEKAIVAALAPYGGFTFERLQKVATIVAFKGHGVLASSVDALMHAAMTGHDTGPPQHANRQALLAAAQELSSRRAQVAMLERDAKQQKSASMQRAAQTKVGKTGHGPGRMSDNQAAVVNGGNDMAALPAGTNLPPMMPARAGAAGGNDGASSMTPQATEAMQKYEHERRALDARWRQLEAVHPILVAYRIGNEDPSNLASTGGGDEAVRSALTVAVQKHANIIRTRSELDNGLHPLTLAPVRELSMQRMGITAGSFDAGLLHDSIAAATAKGWQDYALMAVTIGAAVIAAIPSAGASLVAGAEIVSFAVAAYGAGHAIDEYSTQSALSNNALDRAKSMSLDEPSLFWLAAAIVAVPVSAVVAVKMFTKASALRRAVAAGQLEKGAPTVVAELNAAKAELNAFGVEHGLGDVGERVAAEHLAASSQRAEKVAKQAPEVVSSAELVPSKSELSQPGGLAATEGTRTVKANGSLSPASHALSEHGPDISLNQLRAMVSSGTKNSASKFLDRTTMERVIREALDQHATEISAWLASNPVVASNKAITLVTNEILGVGFSRVQTQVVANYNLKTVVVVLKYDGNGHFLLQTAYPK